MHSAFSGLQFKLGVITCSTRNAQNVAQSFLRIELGQTVHLQWPFFLLDSSNWTLASNVLAAPTYSNQMSFGFSDLFGLA